VGHLWHRALDARFVGPAVVRGSASQFRVVLSKLSPVCNENLDPRRRWKQKNISSSHLR
jgi:hypothetical protein